MYRFSRSIYKELAPRVAGDSVIDAAAGRQQLLEESEAAMRRLAADRRYFAQPARSLYRDVRCLFPINEQLRAYIVIERNVGLALEHLARLPDGGLGLDGLPRQCRATTRRGTPCAREPLPGRDYCPSHKHLEETLEEREPVGAAA